jgi:hypothetical protein
MTDYVGELLRVTASAQDFAAISLTPDDITTMSAEIFDSAGSTIVGESEMAWSADELLWEYLWMTTEDGTNDGEPLAAGTYRVRVRMVDLDGHPSWEYQRVRLSKNPVSV